MHGASLEALAREMRSLLLTDSETRIRQGDMGATLCVVAPGVLRVAWVDEATPYVKSILTDAQKKQFLLEPVVGYPKLLFRLWTEPYRFVSGRTVE